MFIIKMVNQRGGVPYGICEGWSRYGIWREVRLVRFR